MNNIIILLGVFFIFNTSFSQNPMTGNSPMHILVIDKTPEDGYTGSPYVEENFVQGTIVDSKGTNMKAWLRFNTVEDVVEIKLNKQDEEIYELPRLKNISYDLNNYIYELDSYRTKDGDLLEGYFIKYYESDKIKFVAKPEPDLRRAEKAKTGYDEDKKAHLSVDIEYYLAFGEGNLLKVNLKEKDFEKTLPSSPAVEKYLSEHKLKEAVDFQKFIAWFDQQ